MKTKAPSLLTDSELIEHYKKGEKWVNERMQVTGTNKNELGQVITDEMMVVWEKGLARLEALDTEMRKRNLAI